MTRFPLALTLLLACAACGPRPADEMIAIDNATDLNNAAADAGVEVLPPSETVDPAPAASSNAAPPAPGTAAPDIPEASLIPTAMHGRWGQVPGDCDPARAAAAKGLIQVSAGGIRFYEAIARLTVPQTVTAGRFVGHFAFSGEGMRWDKVETLTLDGDTLMRSDADGRTRYQRCA